MKPYFFRFEKKEILVEISGFHLFHMQQGLSAGLLNKTTVENFKILLEQGYFYVFEENNRVLDPL